MTCRKPDSMFGSKSSITRSDIERTSVLEHELRGKPEATGQTEEATPTDKPEEKRPPFQVPMGEMLMRSLAGQDARPRKGTSGLGFMFNCR